MICRGTSKQPKTGKAIVRLNGEVAYGCDGYKHPEYTVLCPNGHFITTTTYPENWRSRDIHCTGGE